MGLWRVSDWELAGDRKELKYDGVLRNRSCYTNLSTIIWYLQKIFGLKYNGDIEGVVCIAFTSDIPATVKELELMSVNEEEGKIAIAYTLWSLKKGAGKKIMKELLKYMKEHNDIDSIMTLSPLTPVATHYHIRNGAKLIKINPTTQNFEYKI